MISECSRDGRAMFKNPDEWYRKPLDLARGDDGVCSRCQGRIPFGEVVFHYSTVTGSFLGKTCKVCKEEEDEERKVEAPRTPAARCIGNFSGDL